MRLTAGHIFMVMMIHIFSVGGPEHLSKFYLTLRLITQWCCLITRCEDYFLVLHICLLWFVVHNLLPLFFYFTAFGQTSLWLCHLIWPDNNLTACTVYFGLRLTFLKADLFSLVSQCCCDKYSGFKQFQRCLSKMKQVNLYEDEYQTQRLSSHLFSLYTALTAL